MLTRTCKFSPLLPMRFFGKRNEFPPAVMALAGLLLVMGLAGCGKFGPPLAPEVMAPAEVRDLQVTPAHDGVTFSWRSPTSDRRGRELKALGGYHVYRRSLGESGPEDFTLITSIEDNHIAARDALRAEARKAGQPVRRIQADAALTSFRFTDTGVVPGAVYLYRVVPFNQGDIEGGQRRMVRIVFRGESSEVAFVDSSTLDAAILESESGLPAGS